MALHRFFLTPEQFNNTNIVVQGEIAHQLQRVLRLPIGAKVILLDGIGNQYPSEVASYNKTSAQLCIIEKQPSEGEPNIQIQLFQALLKGEKFDFVLQKGTELGVSSFVPVLMERCISDAVNLNKVERWHKIVREAAEQSRRGILPLVAERLTPFAQVVTQAEGDLKLLAWEEATLPLKQVLYNAKSPASVNIIIGPEGGITPSEAALAQAHGFQSVSLGSRILRAETAGAIVAALTLYHFS